MPIQDSPGGIGDRVLLIVPLEQQGVERGDRAHTVGAIAAALHQLRQLGKAGRRVALGGWRLANRQGDFSLGHGIAGE